MLRPQTQDIFSSTLFDNQSFYAAFINDIQGAKHQIIIESPFIRLKRINMLRPLLYDLRQRNIQVLINTRNPQEHELGYQVQAQQAVAKLQAIGITVLYTVRHHRKLAIVDDAITWEGSLNILSYYDSCEIMRRINSKVETEKVMTFIGLKPYLKV